MDPPKIIKIENCPQCKAKFYMIPILTSDNTIVYVNPCPKCPPKCFFPVPEKLLVYHKK
jgi:hypothetical protein